LIHATAFIVMLAVLLLVGGAPFVKKFLRGHFHGADVYVVLTLDGKTLAYKNPKGILGQEDKPLDIVPHEIFYSDQFETYYNVCWIDCGTLYRCGHSFHQTHESALYCDKAKVEGHLIGKVLEER
jgi:hypothetical protein